MFGTVFPCPDLGRVCNFWFKLTFAQIGSLLAFDVADGELISVEFLFLGNSSLPFRAFSASWISKSFTMMLLSVTLNISELFQF